MRLNPFGWLGAKPEEKPATAKKQRADRRERGFDAGVVDRLTHTMTGSYAPINEEIKLGLRQMRARSRHIFQNNDYGRRFVQLVKQNVIGVEGITLQARFMRGQQLDRFDNETVERAWREWGEPENCSNDRKLGWLDIQNLAIASVAIDGEVLIHMIETPGEGHGLRLRIIPAEYLDEAFNGDLTNGNRVVMGIEYDRAGVVVAYHLRKRNVRAWINVVEERDYMRIPAAEIIHLHITDFPEQARGIPWAHTAIRRLLMAGRYEEYELVAAVMGASKMGFLKSATGDGSATVDDLTDGQEDDDGEAIEQIEAGVISQLAADEDFIPYDPTHPTTAFDGFMRAVLRGAASGLGVAYASFSNDLENVNFSSIRSGTLTEQDTWRCLQSWLIAHLHQRVYRRWLPRAILHGLPLSPRKVNDKYRAIRWQPRGWPWIDPFKDANAARLRLKMGVDTRQRILAQAGQDFDDTLAQLKYEQEQATAAGVDVGQLDEKIFEVVNDAQDD